MNSVKSDRLKKLKSRLISTALASSEFQQEMDTACADIRNGALKAQNEATVEGLFERILYALLREINISFNPDKEVCIATKRHTGKGRADSRIGALVIEYKHRSKLRTRSNLNDAKKQIHDYIEAISKEIENEVVGYITDGLTITIERAKQGKVISGSGKLELNRNSLLDLIRSITSLEKTALTSNNLIRDFCTEAFDGVLFKTARILKAILQDYSTDKTKMLRSEWEELFRLSHDDLSQQKRIQDRRRILAIIFNDRIDNAAKEYQALFALHTAYAIVLKMIAFRVVSDIRFGVPIQNFKALLNADSTVLRSFCANLEDGEVFRQLGILNLLEGDFFSWYSDGNQWNDDLSMTIMEMLEILSKYEDVRNIFSSDHAIDLFRELYEATVPQVVRASFGEFYTPNWLAEHVFFTSKPMNNWNLLDPCCGSGTFIITAIMNMRKELSSLSDKDLQKEIVNRIKAFDLNPLAVLTTRIHYFIHISDILPENVSSLVIPVFLGDATNVPRRVKVDKVSCLDYQLKTLKEPINITLPISLVDNTAKFVKIMYDYENAIRSQRYEVAKEILISSLEGREKTDKIIKLIEELTIQLIDLESKGWNGIWARIITNFLTTACLGKFTNIIGNPPWIDWKNLPANYREKVKSLCVEKGLFSGAGRTGGINLNICALITHVVIVNWLEKDGNIAFLMPKELAYQASYEGWLSSVGMYNTGFKLFMDWSNAVYCTPQNKTILGGFLCRVSGPFSLEFYRAQVFQG